jgi:hypothetical protein
MIVLRLHLRRLVVRHVPVYRGVADQHGRGRVGAVHEAESEDVVEYLCGEERRGGGWGVEGLVGGCWVGWMDGWMDGWIEVEGMGRNGLVEEGGEERQREVNCDGRSRWPWWLWMVRPTVRIWSSREKEGQRG